MTFPKILPFAALALVACGTAEKDDTSAVEFDDSASEPASAPTTEPPPTTFDVDFVGAYGIASVVDSTGLGGPATVNSDNGPFEIENTFFVVLAFASWQGVGDYDNACILQYTLEDGAVDDSFFTSVSDGWVGWTFPGASNFVGGTPACENLSENFVGLYEHFQSADFGMGLAPMTADMTSAYQDAVTQGGGDWAADYEPYYYTQYVNIDFGDLGGSTGWAGVSLSQIYEIGEDGVLSETTNDEGETINVLIDISEATFAPDGLHYGSPAFGWGFQ